MTDTKGPSSLGGTPVSVSDFVEVRRDALLAYMKINPVTASPEDVRLWAASRDVIYAALAKGSDHA